MMENECQGEDPQVFDYDSDCVECSDASTIATFDSILSYPPGSVKNHRNGYGYYFPHSSSYGGCHGTNGGGGGGIGVSNCKGTTSGPTARKPGYRRGDSMPSSSHGRGVRFAPRVSYRRTLSRYEMTYEEALKCWIFPSEQASTIKRFKHLVEERRQKASNHNEPEQKTHDHDYGCHYSTDEEFEDDHDDDDSTFRGLEKLHDNDIEEMQTIIRSCVLAVLSEQQRQRVEGISDWGEFATVSCSYSENCKANALHMAQHDAMIANRAYELMEEQDLQLELDHEDEYYEPLTHSHCANSSSTANNNNCSATSTGRIQRTFSSSSTLSTITSVSSIQGKDESTPGKLGEPNARWTIPLQRV